MRVLKAIVRYLQQMMREDAYARYCEHLRATSGAAPPTAQQFYLESLERRYKGVSRCC